MPDSIPKSAKIVATLVCLVAWLALSLQLYLNIINATANGLTIPETTGRFFSYFTISTNLIVAVSLTFFLWIPGSLQRFFSKPAVQTAIAAYILVVGLGYNLLLRHLWQPQGWQFMADELLHDAVPLLYVLYWLFFTRKGFLLWKYAFYWLLYPFLYLVYALIRGSVDGFYPYPFINVSKIGYPAVFLNAAGLMIALLAVSFLFIWISRRSAKR